jgi:DNA-binding transcriptional LysR family regulator
MSSVAAARSSGPPKERNWSGIELRHLIALAAVADEHSFRGAADRLGYVQSAISGQISQLERATGMRLFERASGTSVVELTEAGALLLRHTAEILGRLEAAHRAITLQRTRTSRTVRVAGLEHFGPQRLAEIIDAFRRRQPIAQLRFVTCPAHERLERFTSGDLDVVIYVTHENEHGLGVIVEQVPYVLLVPSVSMLAGLDHALSGAELGALQPMVPAACNDGALTARLSELGVAPARHIPGSVARAEALVTEGIGSAVVPGNLTTAADARIASIDLSHLIAPRLITVWSQTETGPASVAAAFRDTALEVCGAGAGKRVTQPVMPREDRRGLRPSLRGGSRFTIGVKEPLGIEAA